MPNRSEAIIIRRTGATKVLEFKLIPPNQTSHSSLATDNVVRGSMETVSLEKYNDLILWLQQNGRLAQMEQMIKTILNA